MKLQSKWLKDSQVEEEEVEMENYIHNIQGKIIAQIGWADKNFKADEIQGFGVGDDEHSWAYDGGRLRKWHKGRWSAFSKIEWKADDIVGCGLDLDNKKMEFYLNGVPLGEAFSGFDIGEGLSPAASFRYGFRELYNPKGASNN